MQTDIEDFVGHQTRSTITLEQVEAVRDTVRGNVRPAASDSIAEGLLRSLVERIERKNAERKERSDDIKDIYAEAKSAGFDLKGLRRIIAIRKADADEEARIENYVDVYKRALGM